MRKGISYEILNDENIKELDEFTRKFIEVGALDNKDFSEWEQNWYLVKDEDKNVGVISLNKNLFSVLLDDYKDIEIDLFKAILSSENLRIDSFETTQVKRCSLFSDLCFERLHYRVNDDNTYLFNYGKPKFVECLKECFLENGMSRSFELLYQKNDECLGKSTIEKSDVEDIIKLGGYNLEKLCKSIIRYSGASNDLFLSVLDIEEFNTDNLLENEEFVASIDDEIVKKIIDKYFVNNDVIEDEEIIKVLMSKLDESTIFEYVSNGKIDLGIAVSNLNLVVKQLVKKETDYKEESEYLEIYDKYTKLDLSDDNKKNLTENIFSSIKLSVNDIISLAQEGKYDNQVICEYLKSFSLSLEKLDILADCPNIGGVFFREVTFNVIHKGYRYYDDELEELVNVGNKIISNDLVDFQRDILNEIVENLCYSDENIVSELLDNKNLNYSEFIASCKEFSSNRGLGYLIDSLVEKEFEDSGKLKEICNLIIDTNMIPSIIRCASELDGDSNKMCEKLVNLRVESEEDKNSISAFLTSDKTDKEFVADLLGNQTDNYYNSIIFDFMKVCPKEKQVKIINAYGNTEKKCDDGMFTMYEKTMVKSKDKE